MDKADQVTQQADGLESTIRGHAERIMGAAGSSLRFYTKQSQHDILTAVIDCFEAGYRSGVDLEFGQFLKEQTNAQ